MKPKCDLLFITHRLYMDGVPKVGGMDRTKEYALDRGLTVALLENPLTTMGPALSGFVSRLTLLQGARRDVLAEFRVWPRQQPWRWFVEPWRSAAVVRRHLAPGFGCVAEDGLSGLVSLRLRRAGYARAAMVHCSDFAVQRFTNAWLSRAYLAIYRHNVVRSDVVMCVSRRMIEHFRRWDAAREYVFLPNSPDCDKTPVVAPAARRRGQLVLLGPSKTGMDHRLLVDALKALAAAYPEVRLVVIGASGAERELQGLAAAAGIASSVDVRGFVPREEALRIVAESWAGVVFYTDEDPFNYYRDSIKIREYAACGIPTLCDASTGTGEEAEGAGAAIRVRDRAGLVQAVTRLMADGEGYAQMSGAARAWAVVSDKRRLLDRLWPRLSGASRGNR